MPSNQTSNPALAAAYRIKRERRAAGGLTQAPAPWYERQEARGMTTGIHSGPIMGISGGRADHRPMAVAAGSYVLPADHVSSLGQGNTSSGMAILGKMFSQMPYGGGQDMRIAHGAGAPRPPRTALPKAPAQPKFAKGGAAQHGVGHPVPIYAADGEFVIPPDMVAAIGGGDIDHGHAVLDAWVKANREKHIKTLRKLPGPAKK